MKTLFIEKCGFLHPVGMQRSVEDGIPIQNLHPIGMHPYRMQKGYFAAVFYRAMQAYGLRMNGKRIYDL